MPDQSQKHHSQDALEVDRLLQQLGTPGQPATRSGPRPREDGQTFDSPRPVSLPSPLGVWARAVLGVVLAGALTQWPYQACGPGLAGYMTGVAMVLIAGTWAAYAAWRRRMGWAHMLAIAVIFGGFVLAAHQILPRVGYAATQATWGCGG